MPRKGTEAAANLKLEPLVRLAREATSGEVSEEAHLAGRARFVSAVERETERTTSRVPARIALAMAAVVMLAGAGWSVHRWRAAERNVEVAVAVEGFFRAPETSPATIELADSTTLVLAPAARARVVHRERRIVVEEGKVELRIAHGPILAWMLDAGPFTVRAAKGNLAMAWSGDREQLDVWSHDADTTVEGGVAGAGIALHGGDHVTARVREGDLRLVRADGAVTTSSNADANAPTNAIITSAPADPSAPPAPASPSTLAQPAPPHATWSALVARGDYDAVLRDADSSGIDSSLAHRPLADLAALADASRYRARTDLAQRALTTERSRFPGSKEAHTAAFLLGRLADDQSHDLPRAIAWYDRYLAEAPTGPFASDALGRKMVAVQASQGPDAARPLAEQYSRRFPHGAYAAQAEEIRGR